MLQFGPIMVENALEVEFDVENAQILHSTYPGQTQEQQHKEHYGDIMRHKEQIKKSKEQLQETKKQHNEHVRKNNKTL